MPEDDEEQEDEEAEEPESESRTIRDQRRQLRSMEKDLKAAKVAQRELAFVRAGVDTDSPLGAFFANSYQGEITPDAVTAAWSAIAPASPPAADSETPAPPAVPEPPVNTGSRERQELANGAAPADARTGSFRQDVLRESAAIMDEGTFADAVTNYVNRMANGVASGEVEPLPNNGYRRSV